MKDPRPKSAISHDFAYPSIYWEIKMWSKLIFVLITQKAHVAINIISFSVLITCIPHENHHIKNSCEIALFGFVYFGLGPVIYYTNILIYLYILYIL